MNLRSKHNTRGASLTELAVVLGVFGIVASGIWTAANLVKRSSKGHF